MEAFLIRHCVLPKGLPKEEPCRVMSLRMSLSESYLRCFGWSRGEIGVSDIGTRRSGMNRLVSS
jgi:hypothetical protein